MISATEEYEKHRMAIISKLYALGERVVEHGLGKQINWGHVGDLSHIDSQLQELLEFLTIPEDRVADRPDLNPRALLGDRHSADPGSESPE